MIKCLWLLCKRHNTPPVVWTNAHFRSELAVVYLGDVDPEEQQGEVPGEQQERSTDPQLIEQRHITQSSKRVQRANRTETEQRWQKLITSFLLTWEILFLLRDIKKKNKTWKEAAEIVGVSGVRS